MSTTTIPPFVSAVLRGIQSKLDFQGWHSHPQFSSKLGLGRTAMIGCILGAILGVHLMFLLQLFLLPVTSFYSLMPGTVQMVVQWLTYVVALSFFHLAEFFVTALYNPSVATADSFMINQSIAYTAAALMAWFEFWIRFFFFPNVNSVAISAVGLVLVSAGQICRTLAMKTCGESFNHVIQWTKKKNHVLVTNGIYQYLRHPSYVGFYYWSIGTQLLLCNPVSTLFFSLASWLFFKRRIPYEEETLMHHFPEQYPEYMSRSWIGIPFVRSEIGVATNNKKH